LRGGPLRPASQVKGRKKDSLLYLIEEAEMGAVATTANIVLGIFNAYMLLRSRHVSMMVVPTIPLDGPARGNDPDTYQIRVQVVT